MVWKKNDDPASLRHGCHHHKAHTDTDPEESGLTWVTDFMKPRILSPGLEQVITKYQGKGSTFKFGTVTLGQELH